MKVTSNNYGNRLIIGPMSQLLQSGYEIAVTAVPETKTLELVDATGFVIGSLIILEERINGIPEVYYGTVLNVVGNVLTLDRPLDGAFTSAAVVNRENFDLSVNGAITPAVFRFVNRFEEPVVLTRMIFNMVTVSAPQYDAFGDLAALTNGVIVRKKYLDGSYRNFPSVKTNNRLQLLMFDIDFFDATLPINANGVAGRLTFDKLGSSVILEKNEELIILIQDDLTGLTSFEVVVEGNREKV